MTKTKSDEAGGSLFKHYGRDAFDPNKKKAGSMTKEEKRYVEMNGRNEAEKIIDRYRSNPYLLECLTQALAQHHYDSKEDRGDE